MRPQGSHSLITIYGEVSLLNFFEVNVGYMVVAAGVAGVRGAGAGLGTCLLGLGLSVEDVLLGSAKGGFNFLDGGFDAGDVLSLVGVFQLGNGCFNCGFLVGGNLVAEFVELLLSR